MHDRAPALGLLNSVEWPTFGLIIATYGVWAWSTTALAALSLPLALIALTLALVLHSSLTHEVIHGHPTPWAGLNAAMMRPALGLVVPYGRFRDQHLAHHYDEKLTDPYDDPETNFMDPAVWTRLPAALRIVLRANNTLLGRLLLGPLLSSIVFMAEDTKAIARGDKGVRNSWLAHGIALLPVLVWVALVAAMPLWTYLVASYAAMSILRLRTFLEHRAHASARARTVVIEDRGIFAFLFLNNNFHVVHHMHPLVAWYKLPAQYVANRAHYLRRNDGYRYASYWHVIGAYLLRPKDPVPHPLWTQTRPSPLSQTPLQTVDAILSPLPIAPQPLVKPED